MLNKRESKVMEIVYSLCDERGICLVAPSEILGLLPEKEKFDEEKLEKILSALELDDYFSLLASERKGEKMYVITLHPVGFAFKRNHTQMKRDLAFKLGWAITSAVIAFLVGMILKLIF